MITTVVIKNFILNFVLLIVYFLLFFILFTWFSQFNTIRVSFFIVIHSIYFEDIEYINIVIGTYKIQSFIYAMNIIEKTISTSKHYRYIEIVLKLEYISQKKTQEIIQNLNYKFINILKLFCHSFESKIFANILFYRHIIQVHM